MKKNAFTFAFLLAALLSTSGTALAVPPRSDGASGSGRRATRANPAPPAPPPAKRSRRRNSRSPARSPARGPGPAEAVASAPSPAPDPATVAAAFRRAGAAGAGLQVPGGAYADDDQYYFREMHPNYGTARPFFAQTAIVFNQRLPPMTSGQNLFELDCYVNSTSADIFAIYLEENAAAIRGILDSPYFTPQEKSPVPCPSGCSVPTYPRILLGVMSALNKKHDNLVKHVCKLRAHKRSEVYTPSQLDQFFRDHLTFHLSTFNRNEFVQDLLCKCFTVNIYDIAIGRGPIEPWLEPLHASEYPRIELEYVVQYFPNLRCESMRSARELIQAFSSSERVAHFYERACSRIFQHRHNDSRARVPTTPCMTIKGVSDGLDDTGACLPSVSFADAVDVQTFQRDSSPASCRTRKQSIHAQTNHTSPVSHDPNLLPSRVEPVPAHVCDITAGIPAISRTPKPTPVTSTSAVYTSADVSADLDLLVKPVSPLSTVELAIEYLGHELPIRSHSIWKIMHAWNTSNVQLLQGRTPDFPTWYRRFALQANHHRLPPSVAWRMANCLLPDQHQDAVLSHIKENTFPGFNRATWCQFVTRLTGGKDATLMAVEQLHSLTPVPNESLSQFLLRFRDLALRAGTPTCLLETGLLAENEFKLLHSIMLLHCSGFGSWVRSEWFRRYNDQATALRSMPMATMSALEKELAIRNSIKSLISDMRTLDAMKQDEPHPAPVFNANVSTPPPPPRGAGRQYPRTAHSNRTPLKPPGYGGPTVHPPFDHNLPNRLQRFNTHYFTYDQAVKELDCCKVEMDYRHEHRMCATCQGRVDLRSIPHEGRRKIVCVGTNGWKECPGLERFHAPKQAAYLATTKRLFENIPRPNRRVSLCAHVLNSTPLCTFPTLTAFSSAACIQLVTSAPTHPDIPVDHVRSHMHTVHGDSAFHSVHVTGVNKHTCVEVFPGRYPRMSVTTGTCISGCPVWDFSHHSYPTKTQTALLMVTLPSGI